MDRSFIHFILIYSTVGTLPIKEFLRDLTKQPTKVQLTTLFDPVIGKSPTTLQLLAAKDEALLVRRYALFLSNQGFHVINGSSWLHLQRDLFANESFYMDLNMTTNDYEKLE